MLNTRRAVCSSPEHVGSFVQLLADLRVVAIVRVDFLDATLEQLSDEPGPILGKLRGDPHKQAT
jgi:hypothetical protein